MCTLTWKPLEDGYALFFNRDEQRARAAPRPPGIYVREGVRFIAPIDPLGGGTWLAVNEYGVTVALLNHYPPARPPGVPVMSRGSLVLAAAAAGSAAEAVDRMLAAKSGACAPFRWVAVDAMHTRLVLWDGMRVTHRSLDPGGEMLTSSSSRTVTVEAARHASLQSRLGSVRDAGVREIEQFHRHRDVDDPALGVCMSREDACTQSFSYVRIKSGEAVLAYEASGGDVEVLSLGVCLPPRQALAG